MSSFFNEILRLFSDTPGDFRAEVFVAELTNNGLPPDKVYFKTRSLFKRSTSKDIEAVKLDISEDRDEQIVMELNREGLYDMIPEGFFHYKNTTRPDKSKETVLEEIRISRLEEGYARKFFGPFENEFFHSRLQLELKERSLLQKESISNNYELFEIIFGENNVPENLQILALLHILPIIYKIRGDLEKTKYCISRFISYNIDLKLINTKIVEKYITDDTRLGAASLGIDAIAGNSFHSFEPKYEIHINGIYKTDIKSFFPNGNTAVILNYLISFLLPFNSNYEIILHLMKKDRESYLAAPNIETFLNYDSYI
ncbi:MAG TPA: type VI secretion system baseplate subunit TssG [Panacibacter sp.]|nr:type VI secretion system baseplate subunit TssG [Panacibacter sp.]